MVGVWRLSLTVYSDDHQEGTEIMVLKPDRTWLHAPYPGKEEIPTQFWKIVHGPRWTCHEGRLLQYHPPPKGGGEHLYDRKILSVTPTTLAFEYMRKTLARPHHVYPRQSSNRGQDKEASGENLIEECITGITLPETVNILLFIGELYSISKTCDSNVFTFILIFM